MSTRSTKTRPFTGAIGTLCALSAVAMLHACDGQPAQSQDEPSEITLSAQQRSYTVRGQIVLIPDPANPATELQIHHEHIPDFVAWDGELHVNSDGVTGMKSMTMPFPVEDTSMLDGFEPGDTIEFTFITDLDEHRFWLSSLTKLSADTELDFSNKTPPPADDESPSDEGP